MLAIARKLQRKLRKGAIKERCGLVLADGSILDVENKHPRPEVGVLFPARELVDHEHELAATWHTHPSTPSRLSQEDYIGFLQWPHIKHYIIANDGVRCYRIEDGLIVEDCYAAR
jgi:proteasome lid subunit RPN8/RPN11